MEDGDTGDMVMGIFGICAVVLLTCAAFRQKCDRTRAEEVQDARLATNPNSEYMQTNPGASFANSWHFSNSQSETAQEDSRSFPNSGHLEFSRPSTTPRMSYPNSDHLGRAQTMLTTPVTSRSERTTNIIRVPENLMDSDSVRLEIPAQQTFTISSLHLDRLRSGLPSDAEALRAPPTNRQLNSEVPSYQSIEATTIRITDDADSPPSYFEVVKDAKPHDLPPPYNAS